jgi:mannose-1-phosphate guanylyltransferase
MIEKFHIFKRAIKKNIQNLNTKNIIIFGIKPTSPSSELGYFLSKKKKKN